MECDRHELDDRLVRRTDGTFAGDPPGYNRPAMRLLAGLCVCVAAAVAHAAEPPRPAPGDASAPRAAGEEPWASAAGSGLLSLPDTTTLGKRHLNLGIAMDNQDRDPLRLDVVDYAITWNYGVRSNVETYGRIVVSRAVAVAERPSLFAPPVDLILPAGAPVPSRPYYLMYAPIPYVSRTGSSQLSKFVPGDAVLGGKVRLLTPRRLRPGVAATLELKLPMARDLPHLQSGAGTGGFDQTLRFTAEWRRPRQSLVASVGLTHVGPPAFGDSLIVFRPEGDANRIDMPIHLASRLLLGLGFRHVLKPSVALLAELTKVGEFGGHTVAFEMPGPLDLTVGGQFRWHRLGLTLGVRYHANSVPPFATVPCPFGGMVDLTSAAPGARDAYLAAIGEEGAVPLVRDRSQIAAFVPSDGPPLPEGARLLPSAYTIRSHGRLATMLVLVWSFGRPRGD
jgi:hypothetical protein